jgi:DHA1 family tetracycline resistance protein-like MFS transporter
MVTGLFFGAIGFSIYGLAPVGWVFLVGVPVMALWGFATPALQALMTARVLPTEQGQLQGAISSLTALAGLVGPALFHSGVLRAIAPGSRVHFPGAPFIAATAMLVLAAAIGWSATSRSKA